MEKRELVNILNEALVPIGFKKKGNYWVINGNAIAKMVNLQKSQFSNSFYINYGYILKSIPLNGLMMHIGYRVAAINSNENRRITELLDFENNISDEKRAKGLKQLMLDKLVPNIQTVNTEEDIWNELKKQPHLNNIPLVVKKHFNLE